MKLLPKSFAFLFLTFLSSCGYRFDGPGHHDQLVSISIPYVQGDYEGHLTNEITRQLTATGAFECMQNGGQLTLRVSILADTDERVGFRYDRNPHTGALKENIVGTENRRTVIAQISLVDSTTLEEVIPSGVVKASTVYDYYDPSSLQDVSFINAQGKRETSINFSLGQLDSIEGAHDDAAVPVFRHLAQKIVDAVMMETWE